MKKVKGTIVVNVVKAMNSNKTATYKKLLSKEGKKLMSQKISVSDWYSYDAYKDCLIALAKIESQGDMEMVRDWGRAFGDRVMTNLYMQIIEEGNVRKALDKFKRFHRIVYNFGKVDFDFISENDINVSYIDFDPDFQEYYQLAIGWIEKFVELCVSKKPISTFLERSWEGAEFTCFRVAW